MSDNLFAVALGVAFVILMGALLMTSNGPPTYSGNCIETGGLFGVHKTRRCDEDALEWCATNRAQVVDRDAQTKRVCQRVVDVDAAIKAYF